MVALDLISGNEDLISGNGKAARSASSHLLEAPGLLAHWIGIHTVADFQEMHSKLEFSNDTLIS